ncbi:MAG: GlcG/HbpS family heme-binding protein, partial [Candidatus Binataceae bacterium]
MEKTYAKRSITAELAARMVEAAVAKAKAIKVPQVVAILDESGLLKAFHRMDGAPLISIEVAQNKAYTALLGAPSQEFFNRIKDNPALLAGAPHIPRIVTFGGGLPIRIDEVVAGGIG